MTRDPKLSAARANYLDFQRVLDPSQPTDLDSAVHAVLDKATDALCEAHRCIRELITQRDRLEEANQRLLGALEDIGNESNGSDQCQYLARKAIAHEESLTP